MGLGKNVANTEASRIYSEKYDYIFADEYFTDEQSFDLTDNYSLTIKNFNHSYDVSRNYGYSISCQQLFLKDKQNVLFSSRFSFGKLFHHYLLHSNNNEYLICGHDLLEFTVYNISKDIKYRFLNICSIDTDSKEDCQNEFWYITTIFYNPDNNLMAINGQD